MGSSNQGFDRGKSFWGDRERQETIIEECEERSNQPFGFNSDADFALKNFADFALKNFDGHLL